MYLGLKRVGKANWTYNASISVAMLRNIIFLVLLFCGLISVPCQATSISTPIETAPLKGIDTILVEIEIGPKYNLLNDHFNTKDAKPEASMTQAIKEVFSDQSWLSIYSNSEFASKQDPRKPNILVLHFTVSSQSQVVDTKSVNVASLGLKISHFLPDKSYNDIKVISEIGYPFVVPASHAEFLKELNKGARFLTNYLPKYLYCVNKSNDTACTNDVHPWEE